jgi:hypothetical protein
MAISSIHTHEHKTHNTLGGIMAEQILFLKSKNNGTIALHCNFYLEKVDNDK